MKKLLFITGVACSLGLPIVSDAQEELSNEVQGDNPQISIVEVQKDIGTDETFIMSTPNVWPGVGANPEKPDVWPSVDGEVWPVKPEVWPGAEAKPEKPEVWPGVEGEETPERPEVWPGVEAKPEQPEVWPGVEGEEAPERPEVWPGVEAKPEQPEVWPGVEVNPIEKPSNPDNPVEKPEVFEAKQNKKIATSETENIKLVKDKKQAFNISKETEKIDSKIENESKQNMQQNKLPQTGQENNLVFTIIGFTAIALAMVRGVLNRKVY
ncbi:LPXTG cell wall anchor domain-containing protein [Vagococcus coleopterorum]|uniref:LPXTG cell wall anchor domain-containing protein n=1 Tax=Vagococcus coleopterorum TaxID=2714946 RepID=A0A6G8APF4_9ENTE|nr:LPXTG cell wall anchor domain-containing protein [Vagococcus coleopterorum]QIL46849.1 LPXTG cell wall anchor domain-containing protein [Vagococcus coleopterorum]